MAALWAGAPTFASQWYFASLLGFVSYYGVVGEPTRGLALVVGSLPGATLLRILFFYNSVVVFLALSVCAVILRYPSTRFLVLRGRFLALFALATAYWLVAFLITGEYFTNLRGLELAFSVAAVGLLAHRPALLGTALAALLLSTFAMGASLVGSDDRLGSAVIQQGALGNPIAFGIPLTLLFFAIAADGGRWMQLEKRPLLRGVVLVPIGLFLILSASRASWVTAAVGVGMIFLFNRHHRGVLRMGLPLLALATVFLLRTERGESVVAWYDRTFSDERTLTERTSGRWDQWILFPNVMQDAPLWGFGPGRGPEVYAAYSLLDPRVGFKRGNEFDWHSLYQQVAVETGILGLSCLLILLGSVVWSSYRCWQRQRLLLPLLGITGFLLISATVFGMGAASGLLLGFGFLVDPPTARGNSQGKFE